MAQWKYTLRWGKMLREAIEAEDIELIAKCIICCYRELLNKLSDEDRDDYEFDINEAIEILTDYASDDEDEIDYYLSEFYDMCDDLRAWIAVD